MTPRATASMPSQATPGRTAAVASACERCSTADKARKARSRPRGAAGGDGEDDGVGPSAGGTQQPDLVGVLHSADLTQGLGGQAEGGAREAGLETHDVERPEMVGEEEPAGR